MSPLTAVLSIHALAAIFMTGLIWTIQLVHYPLFDHVGEAGFANYSRQHVRRITWIAGPMMLVEAAAAVLTLVLVRALPGVEALAWTGLVLLAVIWTSTFALQGPLNARLTGGMHREIIRRLVATNWVRTACWSARGILALLMLVRTVNR